MSKLNKIFNSIPVPIPDRSGFDLSHESIGTATTGTVIPVTHFEVLPGDKISMGSMMSVTLPPFAVPFKGRIDAELTAAFIPYRLLWNGWQSFITQNPGVLAEDSEVSGYGRTFFSKVPTLIDPSTLSGQTLSDELGMYSLGSLADYLGIKPMTAGGVILSPVSADGISALPFLAYHKFCDDWIRDENIIRPFFPKQYLNQFGIPSGYQNASGQGASGRFLPYIASGLTVQGAEFAGPVQVQLRPVPQSSYNNADEIAWDPSIGLGTLRQRCWAKDYFTTATYRPQSGAASEVAFAVSGSSDSNGNVTAAGSFTIASLRAANALQKWMERNNISGTDYGSQILAHFGVTPPDAVMNRSVLLGSVRTPVIVNAVENNSNAETTATVKNPFGTALGSAAGFGSANESGRLIEDFEPKEHGIIMVFFTLIPHAYYNGGIDRQLLHTGYGDFAWPEFAGIGDQAITNNELTSAGNTQVFGYNQRYSEYKFKLDRISGLVADGGNLDVFALQRGFSQVPSLGSEFLEIPKDYLDQVFSVTTSQSGFSCIYDCYFDCSALRVLPEYSLPKL